MTLIETYRANAEDCMRQADCDAAESDRPLWATLARSWLQLAEEAGRLEGQAELRPVDSTLWDTDTDTDKDTTEARAQN